MDERAGRTGPLAVTRDVELADSIARIAAAAGVRVLVTSDLDILRREAAAASLVLIGDDMAVSVILTGVVAHRAGVLLVGLDLDDGSIWRRGMEVGADEVLFLPDAERYLAQRLADVAEGTPTRGARLCVVGGRGGAGASTLAAAIAVTAARAGLAAMLVDADPLGGGIDLVLGDEEAAGMRWPALVDTHGRLSGQALRAELPRADASGTSELAVLSWDRGDVLTVPPEAMRAVLDAGGRAHDLVVVDLPRHRTAAADEALSGSTRTIVVVPAEVRAVAAAARVVGGLRKITADLGLVVRGPAPSGLPAEAVAASLGLELLGEIAAERHLDVMLDRGQAPPRRRGPLGALCAELVADAVGRPGRFGRFGRAA